MSEPLAIQLESWKEKAINGTITIDELTEAIKVLRANRLSAGIAQSKARATKATAAKVILTADDVFADL